MAPAPLDCNVAAFDVAEVAKSFHECLIAGEPEGELVVRNAIRGTFTDFCALDGEAVRAIAPPSRSVNFRRLIQASEAQD